MNTTLKRLAGIAILLFAFIPSFAQLQEKIEAAAAECGMKVSGIEPLQFAERLEDLYVEKYKLFTGDLQAESDPFPRRLL